MSRHAAFWIAWALWLAAAVMIALGILLGMRNSVDFWQTYPFLPIVAAFSTVGALVSSRLPQNPIGWLLCTYGLLIATLILEEQYAVRALLTAPGSLPGGEWAAWTFTWSLELSWGPLFLILLLFPHGRLVSPRWRLVPWFALGVISVGLVTSMLYPANLGANFPFAQSPVKLLPPHLAEAIYGVYQLLVLLVLVVCGAYMILHLRRAQGYERQQLKWFAYATVVAVVSFLGTAVIDIEPVIAAVFTFPLIPIAMGVAILKYRLYDIDVVINRTLVYGSLTATLTLVYAGSVVSLQAALRVFTGQESTLAVVASTLIIAALFNPLRRRVQGFVDRRFYRRKYDAAKTLEAFNARLRDETELETLSSDVVGVVRETMQPAHAGLWLKEPQHRPDRSRDDRRAAATREAGDNHK